MPAEAVALINGGFVWGTYAVDDMTLYVNNGTGVRPGFTMRMLRPSELTRITLRWKTKANSPTNLWKR